MTRPLRILFVMLHAGFVRNYDGVLRQLAARGHQIHVAHELNRNKLGENVLLARLVADCDTVRGTVAPQREPGRWTEFVRGLRTYLDYLRYLEPRYAKADRLRHRVEVLVPRSFQRLARVCRWAGHPGIRLLRRCIRALERSAPHSSVVGDFLAAEQPDLVLVTPLVDVGSDQPDYVRAARDRGIPSALCVASWDNLTNKGVMRVLPDRVFLWNDAQKAEAVALHDVPPDSVVVTGAQIFDHWFGRQPRLDRQAFCARVGLPDDGPFILYLGSSYFIAPNEAEFALKWIAAIRGAADLAVARASILIRPHPNNTVQWLKTNPGSFGRVTSWPLFGADPFDPEFKDDFFDSLFHCAVVVGVNTSAQIEAAIVGRPVCTVSVADFSHSQAGTLHFQHLANPESGLLRIAPRLEAHVGDLAEALTDNSAMVARSRRFVEAFVRPHGLHNPATPRLVEEIERLADLPRQPEAQPEADLRVRRWFVRPLLPLVAWCWRGDNLPTWWVLLVWLPVWSAIHLYGAGLRVRSWARDLTAGWRKALRNAARRVVRACTKGVRWSERVLRRRAISRAIGRGLRDLTSRSSKVIARGRRAAKQMSAVARRLTRLVRRVAAGLLRRVKTVLVAGRRPSGGDGT